MTQGIIYLYLFLYYFNLIISVILFSLFTLLFYIIYVSFLFHIFTIIIIKIVKLNSDRKNRYLSKMALTKYLYLSRIKLLLSLILL